MILVAEDSEYEELTATKWLRDRHEIDVLCIRVAMAAGSQGDEYLSCIDLSEWSLPIYRLFGLNGNDQQKMEAKIGGRRKQPRSSKYAARQLRISSGETSL